MMFRKGIMRKDTEMMTGNILDQSQRNKIIKDNQACGSGKALTVLPGTWKEFPRAAELQLEYVLGTTRENGKEQIAWSMKQQERTMELCYNSEVKQLCLLMCQMETRFCPHLTCSLKMQLLKCSECKQQLPILHAPLQNCQDVPKTKGA